MSFTEVESAREVSPETKKRKREANEEDLEIDLNAPEPPSKKALRKAKKSKAVQSEDTQGQAVSSETKLVGAEDVVPNRGKRSDYGIWIGNLSFTTTKQDLLNFMTGDTEHPITEEKVTRINLPAGPAKHGKFQNKGFAYIDLIDKNTLQSALQLSEKLLSGRRVLIKSANSFEGRPKDSAKVDSGNPPSKRIFIGNLDFDTTADDLESHFGICGPIQQTHMATFEDSGKCKGYAWIEFENLASGQAAMRGWVEESVDDGQTDEKRSRQRKWIGKINGRKLRLEYAEDKTTRYNKRYGKNAIKDTPSIVEVDGEADRQPRARPEATNNNSSAESSQRQTQRDGHKGRKRRYAQDTVQRLTGAIVESKGQKVTFD